MSSIVEDISSFEDLNLKESLLRGIYGYGFEEPSSIQKKAIKPVIEGKDVIAQSQSGTGKTATFTISILQRVDEDSNACQAIIIAHTRELAHQILFVCQSLSLYMDKLKISLCIGGTDTSKSSKSLEGSQIVIGTPGRIIKMIKDRYIDTAKLKMLVIDEADELLSTSFVDQTKTVVRSIPKDAQICLFSATMHKDKLNLTKKFMNNPLKILVNKEELTLEGIKQFSISLSEETWKFDTLCDIYNMISISQSIIYINGRKKAEWLKQKLEEKDFMVSVIHGDMMLVDRTKVMDDFRKGKIRILIATDLIGRGIDIQQVSIVLNYDIPTNKENYLHRIGRSGRFGRKGVAINFVTKREERILKDIEKYYGTQIDPMPENIEDYI